VSWSVLAHWLSQQQQQQQQQLGHPLQELALDYYTSSPHDISGLTALTGLLDLDLSKYKVLAASLTALTHLGSLTRLALHGGVEEAEAACAVTGLRHLQLYGHTGSWAPIGDALTALPDSLSDLKQLSHLSISGCGHIVELPADLGVWLPRLEVLEAQGCKLATVSASLTALRRLDMSRSEAQALNLPSALSGLQELRLNDSRRSLGVLSGLEACTALTHLDVSSTKVLDRNLDMLRPLTRLRRLAFTREACCSLDPGSFTVLGTLQQLTHLTVGPNTIKQLARMSTGGGGRRPKDACFSALASMPPLPHLEQLAISEGYHGEDAVAALGPWLAQLTALTQLKLRDMRLAGPPHKLQQLPVQLRELDLTRTGLEEPPSCLRRLTALDVLRIGAEGRLWDLPHWHAQGGA
jgi:Leucine-rich repeat (LRR) protein